MNDNSTSRGGLCLRERLPPRQASDGSSGPGESLYHAVLPPGSTVFGPLDTTRFGPRLSSCSSISASALVGEGYGHQGCIYAALGHLLASLGHGAGLDNHLEIRLLVQHLPVAVAGELLRAHQPVEKPRHCSVLALISNCLDAVLNCRLALLRLFQQAATFSEGGRTCGMVEEY